MDIVRKDDGEGGIEGREGRFSQMGPNYGDIQEVGFSGPIDDSNSRVFETGVGCQEPVSGLDISPGEVLASKVSEGSKMTSPIVFHFPQIEEPRKLQIPKVPEKFALNLIVDENGVLEKQGASAGSRKIGKKKGLGIRRHDELRRKKQRRLL